MQILHIPERWLQGRALYWENMGLDPVDAIREAINDWTQQAQFERESNPRPEDSHVQQTA